LEWAEKRGEKSRVLKDNFLIMALERFLNSIGIELPERKHHLSQKSRDVLARLKRMQPGGPSDPKPTQKDMNEMEFRPIPPPSSKH
jgi:hypothetical protein